MANRIKEEFAHAVRAIGTTKNYADALNGTFDVSLFEAITPWSLSLSMTSEQT